MDIDGMQLPVSTPEQEGIPSGAILAFLDYLETRGTFIHSFVLVRNGRIASEGYWAPYHKDRNHYMYSVTKTFVSMAVGIAAEEGLLSLDDRIIKFFPDLIKGEIHPWTAEMTIRHLLMMCTVYDVPVPNPPEDPDWIKSFLNSRPAHRPGRAFAYDTAGTHTLTGIVERVTGQSLLDYLTPRLLTPLGITGMKCRKSEKGVSLGGSGLRCTPRDLAKLGVTLLNGGKYNGKQLLPADYVRAATSRQISNTMCDEKCYDLKGYGYQLWMTGDNGFAAFGIRGQFMICFPEHDLVFVTTGGTSRFVDETEIILDALRTAILPAISKNRLPDSNDYNLLSEKVASLEITKPFGSDYSEIAGQVSGKTYRACDNNYKYESVRFDLDGEHSACTLLLDGEQIHIDFSIGKTIVSDFPGIKFKNPKMSDEPGNNCAARGAWEDDETLVIYVHQLDPPYTLALCAHFDILNKGVTITFREFAIPMINALNAIVTFEGEIQ